MSLVLITRPNPDGERLAGDVAVRGWTPLVEPLLDIVWRDQALPDLNGYQAVLFTSANGVRAFGRATDRRDLRVYAVGDATARAARLVGFDQALSAGGDVESLAHLVRQVSHPQDGPMLHVAGTVTAGDLGGRLGERGYQVDRIALYEAHRASALSDPARQAWQERRITAVMLYSPRTALVLGELLVQASLTSLVAETEALCLSPAVAAAAQTVGATVLPWRAVRVAPNPHEGDMLALLADRAV